jgi:hypothetical protein
MEPTAPPRTSPEAGTSPAQNAAKRVRTSKDRERRDRYSIASRWAGLTTDAREGKFLAGVRADLMRHVGGSPSITQRVLIERAAMLTLQLARMDAKALKAGAMSEHASREYLAWSNTLTRTLAALGMRGEPPPTPSLADIDWGRPATPQAAA